MMQFKAGYIVDAIAEVITRQKGKLKKDIPAQRNELDAIDGLLEAVSTFDVEFPYEHQLNYQALHPVLATINNIISRGLPTKVPVALEEIFASINLVKRSNDAFELNYSLANEEISIETVFELLHIIEPGLKITRNNYGGNLGSNLEWVFIKNHPFLKQILQSQRDFSTINSRLNGERTVDFCFTSPYRHWNAMMKRSENVGRIFEVDGPHHTLAQYKYYDAYRDAIAEDENFETIRVKVEEVRSDSTSFEELIGRRVYKIFEKNYNRNVKEYLKEYSLIFIPISVARVQKTILEFLIVHPELFQKDILEIGVVERDFPCGALAISLLQKYFENLNALLEEEEQLILPKIELTIFESPKWVINNSLHLNEKKKEEDFFNNHEFDILIDHCILRRSDIYKERNYLKDNVIKIRSSHFVETSFGNGRRVYCANLLRYKPLVTKNDDGSYTPVDERINNIDFFIQNIFRKVSFRDGQLPIISRALQQKPVIGLLPTGGGKSLTFQLAAFLQPGLCLIVDPIKSLMEDQVRVLRENWIDCCDYINSNLNREEKKKKLIDFRYGESMFLFVSPERFVMHDFRSIIHTIDASKFGLAFSYCVIDEVHCVSEWGHDFRSTYLMLGKNAQRFSKTRSGYPVSLVGLTATASFDVLADIEREIQVKHDDVAEAIIMIENTIRPELFFRVIDVTDKNRIDQLKQDFAAIGENLQKLNNEELIERSKRHHILNFNENEVFSEDMLFKYETGITIDLSEQTSDDFYAIIFCPVKGLNGNVIGVDFVYQNLDSNSKGFFYSVESEDDNTEVHNHFINFTNGKTKHIVCTKAFGMGIDKKDIRATYHYVYSGSLESFVQEAGRSGRDKKISEANILVSKNKYYQVDVYGFFKDFEDHQLLRNRLTRKAIRQTFEQKWSDADNMFIDITFSSIDEVEKAVKVTDFSLQKNDGTRFNLLSDDAINELREMLLVNKEGANFIYIIEHYDDREIHEFFHNRSFKGIDTEKSQFLNLFKIKEFQAVNGEIVPIEKQDTLWNTFNICKEEIFTFTITSTKQYPNNSKKICEILGLDPDQEINPPYYTRTYQNVIDSAYKYSHDFEDFLFLIEEKGILKLDNLSIDDRERLRFVYSRNREEKNDTGRLIYRMHSMGLLEDYEIDYNLNNLFYCTFRKRESIEEYLTIIEDYLRRYLSENTALKNIVALNKRIKRVSLIEDILECLYFLSEFSYKEIASKRKRATDEIEKLMNKSITDEKLVKDWFEQNLYIKEQIFFYFNAKYARIGFKINGQPYSLLDDYKEGLLNKTELLEKYLKVFQLDGTEQNNYKHMMGSCKKILHSLLDTDLKNEWVLYLLKAFAMYSVNNASYISEANAALEMGFDNLYQDELHHKNDFEIIELIFNRYFAILQSNIQRDNPSFKDIKLIRMKLLLKLQIIGIDRIREINLN